MTEIFQLYLDQNTHWFGHKIDDPWKIIWGL